MPKSVFTQPPSPEVMPDPKLEKPIRRVFLPEYKLRILSEADACKHGELGVLLRRETSSVCCLPALFSAPVLRGLCKRNNGAQGEGRWLFRFCYQC